MTGEARQPLFTDEHEELRHFPNRVFERMGELGFLGLHFDEADGGSGGDCLTIAATIAHGSVKRAPHVRKPYPWPFVSMRSIGRRRAGRYRCDSGLDPLR